MAGIWKQTLQCCWHGFARFSLRNHGRVPISVRATFNSYIHIRRYSSRKQTDKLACLRMVWSMFTVAIHAFAEVMVRRANASDYDGVLDILPMLYSGADYMPAYYHSLIKDPCAHPFLAEVNGKVVAFVNYYVTENGTIAVSTGGRCRSEFKGQGVVAGVIKESLALAREHFPDLKTEARVMVESDFTKQITKVDSDERYRIVLERAFYQYATRTENLLNLLDYLKQLPEIHSKSSVSLNEKKVIKRQTIQRSFNEGYFIWGNNRLPAKANGPNIIKTFSTCKAFASLETSTRFNDVYNTISIASFMTTSQGHTLDISINGRCTFLRALEHLLYHLEDRAESLRLPRKAFLHFCFPNDSQEVMVGLKKVIGQFLGEVTRSEDFPSETMLIGQRPLRAINS